MPFKPLYSFDLVVLGEDSDCRNLCRSLIQSGHRVRGFQSEGKACLSRISGPVLSLEQACYQADLVISRLDKESMRRLAYALGDLRSVIFLDISALGAFPSVPFLRKPIPVHSGAQLIPLITGCRQLVKAYVPTGYESLVDPGFTGSDLILVGSSYKAKQIVGLLFKEWHYSQVYDMGGSEMIPALDGLMAYGQDRETTPEA